MRRGDLRKRRYGRAAESRAPAPAGSGGTSARGRHMSEVLQGDQRAPGGGPRESGGLGDLGERQLGAALAERGDHGQPAGQRLDELRPSSCLEAPVQAASPARAAGCSVETGASRSRRSIAATVARSRRQQGAPASKPRCAGWCGSPRRPRRRPGRRRMRTGRASVIRPGSTSWSSRAQPVCRACAARCSKLLVLGGVFAGGTAGGRRGPAGRRPPCAPARPVLVAPGCGEHRARRGPFGRQQVADAEGERHRAPPARRWTKRMPSRSATASDDGLVECVGELRRRAGRAGRAAGSRRGRRCPVPSAGARGRRAGRRAGGSPCAPGSRRSGRRWSGRVRWSVPAR